MFNPSLAKKVDLKTYSTELINIVHNALKGFAN